MKRCLLAATAVALLAAAAPAAALTADELVSCYLETMGGVQKIQSVQSYRMTGKVLVMGMELPFTYLQKRPAKLRIEAEVQGVSVVQVYDGEHGWSINPMMGTQEPQDMSPLEETLVAIQADIDGPLVDWQAKGYTIELRDDDEVEGSPAHVLRLDTGKDLVIDLYFDPDSCLLLKQSATVTMDEKEITQETYFSDYQEVDGMLVAHAIEQRMGGQTQSQIMIEQVQVNPEIDDAVFEKPAPEPEPDPGEDAGD